MKRLRDFQGKGCQEKMGLEELSYCLCFNKATRIIQLLDAFVASGREFLVFELRGQSLLNCSP